MSGRGGSFRAPRFPSSCVSCKRTGARRALIAARHTPLLVLVKHMIPTLVPASPWLARTALALLSVSFLLLGACASAGDGDTEGSEPRSLPGIALLAGHWELTEIGGEDIASLLGEHMRVPSLSIQPDGAISGYTGLNNVSGRIDLAQLAAGDFDLGQLAMTKRAGPPEAMALEQRFVEALRAADWPEVEDDTLTLGEDDTPLLRFRRGM